MNNNIPLANVAGQHLPEGPAPVHHVNPNQPVAEAVPGAAEPHIATNANQARNPTGVIPRYPGSTSSGISPMLKVPAARPMSTVLSRELSTFIPDASMLFHVLDNCDAIMSQTERFTRTSHAWLPIVSQLYISFLWNFMILSIQSNSSQPGYSATALAEIYRITNPQDCLIPGPLVPFFQALGSFNGPYTWMGNICPVFPGFNTLWNAAFHVNSDFVRLVPIPAIILDQLHYFATWIPPANQTVQANFLWYRNIFQQGIGAHNRLNRMGPQLTGSLHAPDNQITNARTFWQAALSAGITRTNAANAAFTRYSQLFGLTSQTHTRQSAWFTHVSTVMQRYCQYFNGSVALRTVRLTGNGNVVVYAIPRNKLSFRNWLYPTDNDIEPFLPSRSSARRSIPDDYEVILRHSHHTLEDGAESYAILTQVNTRLVEDAPETQNGWTAINPAAIHSGTYWEMSAHRTSNPISTKARYSRTISNRFAQPNGNRVE